MFGRSSFYDNEIEKEERDESKRKDSLDSAWYNSMPCVRCSISEVCRHKDTIKRPDYNGEVFTVTVTCALFDKYQWANNNG